jgi:hypothetical protein
MYQVAVSRLGSTFLTSTGPLRLSHSACSRLRLRACFFRHSGLVSMARVCVSALARVPLLMVLVLPGPSFNQFLLQPPKGPSVSEVPPSP